MKESSQIQLGNKEVRLLMVAYKYPPLQSVGVLRNYRLSHLLHKQNVKVWIISTNNRKGLPPASALPIAEDLPVEAVSTLDFRTLLAGINASVSSTRTPTLPYSRWSRWLRKLKDSFPFNLLMDEGGIWYIFHAYRKGKKWIREHQITHIYSSFRPFADHFVAFLLKRKFPELVWVADFRDPHVDENRHNVYWPTLQWRINRYLVQRADEITTVSEGLKDYLHRLQHPSVRVFRNAVSTCQIYQPTPPFRPKNTRFTITYTGSIYPDYQDSTLLFQAIRKLIQDKVWTSGDCLLRYVGPQTSLWKQWLQNEGLTELGEIKGPCSFKESWDWQQSSDINLLLSWSGPVFSGILTGKLFEYLAAGPPVLALVKGGADPELNRILLETQQVGVLNTVQDIRQFLLDQFQRWQTHEQQGKRFIPAEKVYPYTWEAQTKDWMALFATDQMSRTVIYQNPRIQRKPEDRAYRSSG